MPRALPRSLAFALAIWAIASAAAVAGSDIGAPAALVVGVAGGTLFGLVSAGRVGGRRVRVRTKVRRRRSRTTVAEPGPAPSESSAADAAASDASIEGPSPSAPSPPDPAP